MDDIRPPKFKISRDKIVARNYGHLGNGALDKKTGFKALVKRNILFPATLGDKLIFPVISSDA